MGLIYFLQHCAFSALSGLYTDLRADKGKPLLMSEAAESCLPSPLFWHELLSVILHCILLKSAFWSSSVALNCAPPNMLDVWPDLQAKGVRQIKNRTLFKFPFSLFTNTVRRHLDGCSPFCSVVYCVYRCCTHTTLAYL